MHAKVLLKIDKMGSYSTSNVISGEIDSFLNEAINDYINQQKVALRRPSGDRQSIEAMENLRPLEEDQLIPNTDITEYSISTPGGDINVAINGFEINLSVLSPSYGYYVDGRAHFSDEYWKNCMLVNRSFINKHGTTKFNKPVFWELPVMIDEDKLVGLTSVDDSNIPDQFYINYLKEAKEIHLDDSGGNTNDQVANGPYDSLPPHTHETLVKMAAQKIIQSLSGQQAGQQKQEQEEGEE